MGQFLPARLTRQPQQLLQIDRANPITRGLLFAMLPCGGGIVDATGTAPGILAGPGATPSVGRAGRGLTFNGTSPLQVASSSDTRFNLDGECTIIVLCKPTNVSNGSYGEYPIGSGDVGAGTSQGALRVLGVPSLFWGSAVAVSGATSLTNGVPIVLAGTRSGTAGAWTAKIYVDGRLDGSAAASHSPGTQQILAIGSFGAASLYSLPFNGDVNGALVFNRALSPAEIAAISANPSQVFAAPPRRLLVEAPGAGPVNATGTLASTLANATIAASGITLNAGAFASTLANATMSASGSVGAAPSGALASTLGNATMAATGAVTDVGSFASTLSGASMAASGILIDQGAFNATTGNATMAASGTVAPNATGTLSSTLDGATMTAYGYNGVPPVLAGFFQRLPKTPRHVQRIP